MYHGRYVYVPTFESGGSFFPKMFRRWIFALFSAQATMVGMCLLKQGFKQAYSVMFLMVLTYVYKVCLSSFFFSTCVLSLCVICCLISVSVCLFVTFFYQMSEVYVRPAWENFAPGGGLLLYVYALTLLSPSPSTVTESAHF